MQPQESITRRIAEMVDAGRQAAVQRKLREADAALKRQEESQARCAEQWAPHLAALTACLPEWTHAYIVQPTYEYATSFSGYGPEFRPVAIHLPKLAVIFAYVLKGDVHYYATQPGRDEDGKPMLGLPYEAEVASRYAHEILVLETDFAIAMMAAKESFDQYTRMLDSWEHTPAPEPKTEPVPLRQRLDGIDTAGEVVSLLESASNTPAERGILWGMLSIATELRGIRIAVEDIAAALLQNEEA